MPTPMPTLGGRGWCRWCDLAVLHGADHEKAGEPDLRRRWHPECVAEYKIACGWDEQRQAVYCRDRGYCAVCRRRGRKVVRAGVRGGRGSRQGRYPFSRVRPVFRRDWHVDHVVPLWRVPRGLPLAERARFWGLRNLQTLCEAHHREKTSRGAEERRAIARARPPSSPRPAPCDATAPSSLTP